MNRIEIFYFLFAVGVCPSVQAFKSDSASSGFLHALLRWRSLCVGCCHYSYGCLRFACHWVESRQCSTRVGICFVFGKFIHFEVQHGVRRGQGRPAPGRILVRGSPSPWTKSSFCLSLCTYSQRDKCEKCTFCFSLCTYAKNASIRHDHVWMKMHHFSSYFFISAQPVCSHRVLAYGMITFG